jgi:alpha-1,3-glucan synthase
MFFNPNLSSSELPMPPNGPGFGSRPSSAITVDYPSPNSPWLNDRSDAESIISMYSEDAGDNSLNPPRFLGSGWNSSRNSIDSIASTIVDLDSIVGGRKDFKLQQVDPFFTDSDGKFYDAFDKKLQDLSSKNSISQLCIEEYLVKSERKWFGRFHDAKIGLSSSGFKSTASLLNSNSSQPSGWPLVDSVEKKEREEFGLGDDYVPPTGLKK